MSGAVDERLTRVDNKFPLGAVMRCVTNNSQNKVGTTRIAGPLTGAVGEPIWLA